MIAEAASVTTPCLRSCHCCGLLQTLPTTSTDLIAVCRRCHTPLRHRNPARNRWTAALALSALMFYIPALLLPLLRIERLGHAREDSLLAGITALWGQGYWLIGTVILLFSVVLPPLKLVALWFIIWWKCWGVGGCWM